MSKQLLSIVAICSLALPSALFSQQTQPPVPAQGRITGTVITAAFPLIAAEVTARKTTDSTFVAKVLTAVDGRFLVDKIALGSYTVHISFLGYKTRTVEKVVLTADSPAADLGVLKMDGALMAERNVKAATRSR